jgi:hypothetical protein
VNPDQTMEKVVKLLPKKSKILDVGSGMPPLHKNWFTRRGMIVDTCDFFPGSTYQGDFNKIKLPRGAYDCLWLSHVLEHQLNVGMFLKKCYRICKKDGMIAVTVPPRTTYTAGGHVTQWNPGMLIYNLVLAGFDCSDAHIKQYGYNQSVIAYKKPFKMPPLKYDSGDLKTLNKWLPKGLEYKKFGNFEGDIEEHNW